jgi:hypothetical protein
MGVLSDILVSKWEGRHKTPGDLTAKALPWGFLTQDEVQELVIARYTKVLGDAMMETRAARPGGDWYNSDFNRVGAVVLDDHGYAHADVVAGATNAFHRLAETFAPADAGRNSSVRVVTSKGPKGGADGADSATGSPDAPADDSALGFDVGDLDICSPSLSHFINAVAASHRDLHRVCPRLVIRSVDARILRVAIEQGSTQKPGQIMMMDPDEIMWNLSRWGVQVLSGRHIPCVGAVQCKLA